MSIYILCMYDRFQRFSLYMLIRPEMYYFPNYIENTSNGHYLIPPAVVGHTIIILSILAIK